jgi:hypothetical protein
MKFVQMCMLACQVSLYCTTVAATEDPPEFSPPTFSTPIKIYLGSDFETMETPVLVSKNKITMETPVFVGTKETPMPVDMTTESPITMETPELVTLTTPAETSCAACRNVLDGPSLGEYALMMENSPKCGDGCVYGSNSNMYCFAPGGDSKEVSGCKESAVTPTETPAVTIAVTLADSCPTQKTVTDGPLAGTYEFKVQNPAVCDDGCIYERDSELYCFTKGTYTIEFYI